MKKETIRPPGVIDALTAGINLAARYPWPLAIPVAIDLVLWLAPRLSVGALLQRLIAGWESVVRGFYTPAQMATMSEMFDLGREAAVQIGQSSNLAFTLAGSWLAAPSAVAGIQANRLKLVSDAVLAPVGFGLDLPQMASRAESLPALEMGSAWQAVAVVIGLWLLGQLLAALYLRWTASGLVTVMARAGTEDRRLLTDAPRVALLPLTLRFVALSLFLGAVVFVLRLPLVFATAMTMVGGSTGASLLFVFGGGLALWLTLWFLVSLFFVSEAIVLDGQPLWPSLWQSTILVRRDGMRMMGLVILVNLIMLGFRAVWGLIGQSTAGAVAAIFGNAFLGTAMLFAVFVYYIRLRARATQPQPGRAPGNAA